MARFTIYSPTGVALYEGTPTFTGQYRKPGMLEFRNVGVPTYLDFSPGCYVGYESGGSVVPQYPRTGFGYKIYTVPQVKKQARSGSYGGAFEYQSIQLYDASKELEYCPFRDIVKGDNRIHFSTQPSISTFEGCDGLASRFEACLRDQYDEGGVQSWQVRTATAADGASRDLLDLMADAREFTVSGMNILECLDKIYDIWPEVGWIYTMETVGGRLTNTIIIGGAGLNPNQGTYAYGKGSGLKSLTRTVANADELANRIFAYGSQRNMSSDWYRFKSIKDAESVDIKHLMIPTSYWGETDGQPDAAKAFVDDGYSIERRGLHPRTAYFDGTEDLPEIYPTIEGMTIWDVRMANPDYVPHNTWSDSARVDELADADGFYDDGYSGYSGQSRLSSLHFDVPAVSATAVVGAESEEYAFDVFSNEIEGRGIGVDIEATINFGGVLYVENATRVWTRLEITTVGVDEQQVLAETEIVGTETETGSGVWNVTGGQVSLGGKDSPLNKPITVSARVFAALAPLEEVEPEEPDEEEPNEEESNEEEPVVPTSRDISINTQKGSGHIYVTAYRRKTFHVTLRQVGFDIAAQGDLGDGKVISMRSGKCQGRSFAIKDAILNIADDSWDLECYRSEDESVGQWFPNSAYPVEYGDRFVLLDIAMPDSYIDVAENRLYSAAQSLLSDTATERWQYIPEIDAKYMVENDRSIRAGENMTIVGVDIVEGEEGFVYLTESTGSNLQTTDGENLILDGSGYRISVMVDTVVIAEGESTIPTYKVTLLDRKRKVFTESKSVSEYTAKSVANARQVETSKITSESSFFELCDDNSVKLKDKYIGLWADGWMAAGGVAGEGEGGGGGGGGGSTVTISNLLTTGTRIATITIDGTGYDVLAPSGGGGGTTVQWGTKVPGYSRVLDVAGVQETVLLEGALDAIDWFTVVTVDGNPTLKLNTKYVGLWAEGWVSAGGVGSGGGGGGGESYLRNLLDVSLPTPPSTPGTGDLLSWNGSVWTNIPQSSITPDLTSINSRLTSLENSVTSLQAAIDAINWFIPTTVTLGGVDTLTLKLNPIYAGMWAEGWVSAGGVGASGSGGASFLWQLDDVDVTTRANGDLLSWNGTDWVNVPRSSIQPDMSGYLPLTGGTLTGTLGASGWSITTGGVGEFNTIQGKGNANLFIGHSNDSAYVYIQEDTYMRNQALMGGTASSASDNIWIIEPTGDATFKSVSVIGGTSSGFLKADGSVDTGEYLTNYDIGTLTLSAGTFTAGSWTPLYTGSFNIPTTSGHISHGNGTLYAFLEALPNNYVTLATDQNNISGTKTFTATNLYAKNFLPASTTTYNIGSSSARWNKVFSDDADFSGDVSVGGDLTVGVDLTVGGDMSLPTSGATLFIGPVRIEYDPDNYALHIFGTDSNHTIGLYCDGFVAAGGPVQTT